MHEIQNVCLLHGGLAAQSGVQRILNDLHISLYQLARGL